MGMQIHGAQFAAVRILDPGLGIGMKAMFGARSVQHNWLELTSTYLSRSLILLMPTRPHSSSLALGSAPLTPIAPTTSSPAMSSIPPAKVSKLVSALIFAATPGSVFVKGPTCEVGILKVSA